MKVTRTYLDGCKYCSGTGVVRNPFPTTTAITTTCPVCNGNKVITVTEEYELLVEIPTEIIPIIQGQHLDAIMNIPDRILFGEGSWKTKRKRTGLSLRQVAKETKLSPATISRIERGVGKNMYLFSHTVLTDFYKKWKEQNTHHNQSKE